MIEWGIAITDGLQREFMLLYVNGLGIRSESLCLQYIQLMGILKH
jgi:hypothetical protein